MSIYLRDDLRVEIPEFTEMYLGDSDKPRDFNRTKAFSTLGKKIQLIVDLRTSCSGTLINGRVYPASEVVDALPTWTDPYPQPFLSRHPKRASDDPYDEPEVLGRVLNARFKPTVQNTIPTNDWINPPARTLGSGSEINSVLLSDKDAAEQVLDKRLLTVSVGRHAGAMVCPICLTDWVPSMRKGSPGCEHRPGKAYDVEEDYFTGKLPFYFIARDFRNDHIAKTWRPAQPYSSVIGIRSTDGMQDVFQGEVISSTFDALAMFDSDGHVVRFAGEIEPKEIIAAKISDAEADVLAAMSSAGVLDFSNEHEDGYSVVDLQTAINRAMPALKAVPTKCRTGIKGALLFQDKEHAHASLKLLSRYRGPQRELLGLKILASMNDLPYNVDMSGTSTTDIATKETEMSWDQVQELADKISEKLDTLSDTERKDLAKVEASLGKDLYQKISFDSITKDQRAEIVKDDLDSELDLVAGGEATDKVLTSAARKKLPDSAFCGPDRSFPANDAAHVRNGLARLPQAKNFTSEQKSRILACLKRKAKKFGVEVGNSSKDSDTEQTMSELEKLRDELESLKTQKSALEAEKTDLKTKLEEAEKLIDQHEKQAHLDLVDSVFDLRRKLKKPDVDGLDEEGLKELKQKLESRSAESLRDSLADLKLEESALPDQTEAVDNPQNLVDGQQGDLDGEKPKAKAKAEKPLSNKERIRRDLGKSKSE